MRKTPQHLITPQSLTRRKKTLELAIDQNIGLSARETVIFSEFRTTQGFYPLTYSPPIPAPGHTLSFLVKELHSQRLSRAGNHTYSGSCWINRGCPKTLQQVVVFLRSWACHIWLRFCLLLTFRTFKNHKSYFVEVGIINRLGFWCLL